MNPEERFNKLFEERSKWTKEDLEPYLTSLVSPVPANLYKGYL